MTPPALDRGRRDRTIGQLTDGSTLGRVEATGGDELTFGAVTTLALAGAAVVVAAVWAHPLWGSGSSQG